MSELRTERLRLRQWCRRDLAPYAALNADPAVMEHFPAPLTRAESDAHAERARAALADRGWGLWAVEVIEPSRGRADDDGPRLPNHERDLGEPLGFVGLAEPRFEAHFTPAVEIGWRLSRASWGHGYASEAARAAAEFAFADVGLRDLVSFTAVDNRRSRRVMERLGMIRDPEEDFRHPGLPGGHPLAKHVLYRLSAAQFRSTSPARCTLPPAAKRLQSGA